MDGWNASVLLGLMAYFQVRLELLVSGSTVSCSPRKKWDWRLCHTKITYETVQLYCFLLGNWHRTNKWTLKIIIPSYLVWYVHFAKRLRVFLFFLGATKYLESPSLRPILSVPSEASTGVNCESNKWKKKKKRKVRTFFGQNCPSPMSSTWWTYKQLHTPMYIIYNYTYYIYILYIGGTLWGE